jgi:hypothetical protein
MLIRRLLPLLALVLGCSSTPEAVDEDTGAEGELRNNAAVETIAAVRSGTESFDRVIGVITGKSSTAGTCKEVRGVIAIPTSHGMGDTEGLAMYATLPSGRVYLLGMHPDPGFDCDGEVARITNGDGRVDLRAPGPSCVSSDCARLGELERDFYSAGRGAGDGFNVIDTRAGNDKFYVEVMDTCEFVVPRKTLGAIVAVTRDGNTLRISGASGQAITVTIKDRTATIRR